MEKVSLETVHEDLKVLKNLVSEMKEHMEDCFLTAEEEEAVEKAREEFEKGETISLEDLELERKNARG
jgi:uncharacterized coiled-coil DUF342 family protein|tara:strand:+ start:848 stop:1051 length:204 start_codon:yes stop_codon:yes gene_type:complete